jgi:RHS repeat-associated protein
LINLDDPMLNDAAAPHRNSSGYTISWTYDQAGNKLSQTNANNQAITFSYDAMNHLLQQNVPQTPSPVATTKYTYDDVTGLLKTMQDPRLVATGSPYSYVYTYDLMGRKTRLDYPPDSGGTVRSESFVFDTSGNLHTYTNRAGTVQTFTYDGRNRQVSSTWSDGTTAPSLAYDAASRITQISNADAVINNIYFGDNTLQSQEEWATAASTYHHTVTYAYDVDHNRANITYPSGKSYSYGYYGRNDLWYVLDNSTGIYQAAYIYDVNGNVTTRYVGNNWIVTDASQRNPMNQIKYLEHQFVGTPTTRTFDYTYNSMGSRTSIKRDAPAGPTENYSYDLAQEVTAGVENGTAATYGYDANGNRTALNGVGGIINYNTNNLNEQTTFNAQTVGYDTKGNVTGYGSTASYVYDAQNRLKSVTNGTVTSTFKYDGLNRKISQTISGVPTVTTYNVWDGWNLIEERNATNTLLQTYLYGAGEIVERITGTTNSFYFQDGLGSTSHFSDEWGVLAEAYKYDTFGKPTVYDPTGAIRTNGSIYDIRHLYTGQLWMPQAGLYDYRNRAYSPTLTRFLQPDPVGFASDPGNLYRYSRNNPVNQSDPTGLDVETGTHPAGFFPHFYIGVNDWASGGGMHWFDFHPYHEDSLWGIVYDSGSWSDHMTQASNFKMDEYAHTTPEQDLAILNALQLAQDDPAFYSVILADECSQRAYQVLHAALGPQFLNFNPVDSQGNIVDAQGNWAGWENPDSGNIYDSNWNWAGWNPNWDVSRGGGGGGGNFDGVTTNGGGGSPGSYGGPAGMFPGTMAPGSTLGTNFFPGWFDPPTKPPLKSLH